jgi:hypothetical protein
MNTLTAEQRIQDELSAELVSLALKNPRSIAFHILYHFHPEFGLWIHNLPSAFALAPSGLPARKRYYDTR